MNVKQHIEDSMKLGETEEDAKKLIKNLIIERGKLSDKETEDLIKWLDELKIQ